MVRYIRASVNNDIFTTESTGMSFYDNFLDKDDLKYMQDSRNLTGEIKYMTPSEYYSECAKLFGSSVDRLVEQRTDDSLKNLVQLIKQGKRLYLPIINYPQEGQEGLHRMLAAKTVYGDDIELPVLVVTTYDEEREQRTKRRQEMKEFEEFEFVDVCSSAIYDMTDTDKECPGYSEILEQFNKLSESIALKRYSVDIVVDSEIVNTDEGHVIKAYLDEYQNMTNPDPFAKRVGWLEDMYMMPEVDDLDDRETIDDIVSQLISDDIEQQLYK